MKVKHFHIRLSKEGLQQDESKINDFMETVAVKKTVAEVVSTEQAKYWSVLIFYEDNSDKAKKTQTNPAVDLRDLTNEERGRYEMLKKWRRDTAMRESFPDYMIASNAELFAIAKLNPYTADQLYNVKGMGEKKIGKYGGNIISLLNSIR